MIGMVISGKISGPPGTAIELSSLRVELTAHHDQEATTRYLEALENSDLAGPRLFDGMSGFNGTEARLIHDSPFKHESSGADRRELLISQLAPYRLNTRQSIYIISPYFVPGGPATTALNQKVREGVEDGPF